MSVRKQVDQSTNFKIFFYNFHTPMTILPHQIPTAWNFLQSISPVAQLIWGARLPPQHGILCSDIKLQQRDTCIPGAHADPMTTLRNLPVTVARIFHTAQRNFIAQFSFLIQSPVPLPWLRTCAGDGNAFSVLSWAVGDPWWYLRRGSPGIGKAQNNESVHASCKRYH